MCGAYANGPAAERSKMHIEEISSTSAGDLDAVIELLHRQMTDIGSSKPKERIRKAVQNALQPGSRARFFVLYRQSVPVGLAFLNVCSGIESEGDYVWLNEIQIDPIFRKQGYGKYLLNHIVQWAQKNRCKHVFSVTAPKNTASQTLFQSMGFQAAETQWMDLEIPSG